MPLSSSKPSRSLVFLTVNSSFSHSSLALPLLHSACKDLDNWEWKRYDMTLKDDVMKAVRAIYELHCDLLVTDLYLFNRAISMEVLERYHALDPNCLLAVGGPECLGEGAEKLLEEYPFLSAVFRGEGEEIFHDFLAHFEVLTTTASCRIFPQEGNGVFQAWTSSPFPVSDPFFVTEKPFVQMETARGCPMKCFYCTSGGTLPRYRTLEEVHKELTLLAAKGVKDIRVLDRTFNLPEKRGAALLRLFREEFPKIHFHLEIHPQFLNEAMEEELSRALPGQLHIEAGIQCLDPKVLEGAGRYSKVEKVKKGLSFLTAQTAFETHTDLLAGLPGQNYAHILSDAGELIRLKAGEIQLEVLKALPGTPLRKIAPLCGLIYNPRPPDDVMKTASLTLEEMQYARDLSRLLDMTYNHKALHNVLLEMAELLPELLPELLAFFHQEGGNSGTLWDLKKRFLFLLAFGQKHKLGPPLDLLAFQWLKAGFPPGTGADSNSFKTPPPPEGALLLEGMEESRNFRETRYYALILKNKRFIFAFNRSFSQNLPAAIWQEEV